MNDNTNILLIVADDLGYSDLGCYGGEIDTPNLDSLANGGLRFTDFYSTPRCAPSRACLLTGLHPHQTGIGILTYDDGPKGYPGNLNKNCVTIAEVLKDNDYKTYLSGKWHLAKDIVNKNDTWPLQRGFDRYYGTLAGSCSYYLPHSLTRDNTNIEKEAHEEGFYYTDAITKNAIYFIEDHVQQYPDNPFFQYVAYTAPHWPLHAPEDTIKKYKGRFDEGWDILRERRFEKLKELGIVKPKDKLSPRDSSIPQWDDVEEKEWYLRCMEVYAAQVDVMDQGIGKIIETLERLDQRDNTLIIFLSDNGGCNEIIKPHPEPGTDLINNSILPNGEPVILGNHKDILPGAANTFQTYSWWANLSNTPFRLYKSWVHEGGIATPCIINWGDKIKDIGGIRRTPGHLVDLMPTILEVAGATYPETYKEHELYPLEGRSLVSEMEKDTNHERYLYWEHQGNCGVRHGNWKLVRQFNQEWELYDLSKDRIEECNIIDQHPSIAQNLIDAYREWTNRCGVIPREQILSIEGRRTVPNEYFGWMI